MLTPNSHDHPRLAWAPGCFYNEPPDRHGKNFFLIRCDVPQASFFHPSLFFCQCYQPRLDQSFSSCARLPFLSEVAGHSQSTLYQPCVDSRLTRSVIWMNLISYRCMYIRYNALIQSFNKSPGSFESYTNGGQGGTWIAMEQYLPGFNPLLSLITLFLTFYVGIYLFIFCFCYFILFHRVALHDWLLSSLWIIYWNSTSPLPPPSLCVAFRYYAKSDLLFPPIWKFDQVYSGRVRNFLVHRIVHIRLPESRPLSSQPETYIFIFQTMGRRDFIQRFSMSIPMYIWKDGKRPP